MCDSSWKKIHHNHTQDTPDNNAYAAMSTVGRHDLLGEVISVLSLEMA